MNDALPTSVHAVGRPTVPVCRMPARFRTDVAYFGASPIAGEKRLPAGEYRIDPASIADWLAAGVLTLVSPLDATHVAEVEITEDQERFVHWLHSHTITHVRVE